MRAHPPHLPDFVRLLHDLSAYHAGGRIKTREISAKAPPPITLLDAPPAPASWRAGHLLRQLRRRAARLFRSGDGK